jgi:O-acetyl-ADP-ribose deacetylase (regulator of RNase III)
MTETYSIKESVLELTRGDITLEETQAIVNAANKALSPGGGVSGAIHRAAGPGLWQEAKTLGGCGTGEARLTRGHDLKAKYVIHTVGPVYSGSQSDRKDFRNSYYNSLKLAAGSNIESISFPSISTGIFGYPVKEASRIALETIAGFLEDHPEIKLVKMILFSQEDYQVYKNTLDDLRK